MIPTKAYSELLRTLYAAPFDVTQWQPFLTQLCDFTHSTFAFFFRNDGRTEDRLLACGGSVHVPGCDRRDGVIDGSIDLFREVFRRNPRVGILEDDDTLPRPQWMQSHAFRPVAEPYAIHMTCMVLSASNRAHDWISLWRGPERPQLEQEYRDLLTMLIPHLQNALKLKKTFSAAERRAQSAEAMLDSTSTAYLLLNGTGVVLHMNEAAKALVRRSDGLVVQGLRVVPADRAKRAEFAALVNACTSPQAHHPGAALALGRASAMRPLQVLMTPIRPSDPEAGEARVLLVVTDPETAAEFSGATLRQMYGLTPAETGIANALLSGSSLDEIAKLRTVSVATVRSQMKNLLGKTDTQRQGDLIRLLATLPQTVASRAPLSV